MGIASYVAVRNHVMGSECGWHKPNVDNNPRDETSSFCSLVFVCDAGCDCFDPIGMFARVQWTWIIQLPVHGRLDSVLQHHFPVQDERLLKICINACARSVVRANVLSIVSRVCV